MQAQFLTLHSKTLFFTFLPFLAASLLPSSGLSNCKDSEDFYFFFMYCFLLEVIPSLLLLTGHYN